jgi:putative membrane protein insertion efficiency factor
MKSLILILISNYKNLLSPILGSILGGSCRFTPTCSEYSYSAIKKYGTTKGLKLSLKRILKCHPFSEPAFDPIP